jgi:hypothetical protein
MVALAQRIQDGSHKQDGLFSSVVGQIKTHEKRWVIDIDEKTPELVNQVIDFIDSLEPVGPKVETCLPTKDGYHLITKRFDSKTFSEQYPEITLQKKNPTLLFLPKSLNYE